MGGGEGRRRAMVEGAKERVGVGVAVRHVVRCANDLPQGPFVRLSFGFLAILPARPCAVSCCLVLRSPIVALQLVGPPSLLLSLHARHAQANTSTRCCQRPAQTWH